MHIYPVIIKGISPPIHCLLARPTEEFRCLPTVIYYHGLNGTRNQIFQERYKEFARVIQKLNCNLLSVDLRCHGNRREKREHPAVDSIMAAMKEPEKNPFDGSIADNKRIVQFLIEKSIAPRGEIAVAGMSWGAVHALYAMQHESSVQCGITLLPVGRISSMVEFRPLRKNSLLNQYEPMNYITRIAPKPLLMVPADQDHRVNPQYASELFEKLRPSYQKAEAEDNLAYRMLLGVRHTYDSRMTAMAEEWLKTQWLSKIIKRKKELGEN